MVLSARAMFGRIFLVFSIATHCHHCQTLPSLPSTNLPVIDIGIDGVVTES